MVYEMAAKKGIVKIRRASMLGIERLVPKPSKLVENRLLANMVASKRLLQW